MKPACAQPSLPFQPVRVQIAAFLPLSSFRTPLLALTLAILTAAVWAQSGAAPAGASDASQQQQAELVDFVRDIQPIFRDHCYECHVGTIVEGGLNLGVKANAYRGGDSEVAFIAGKSDESLLIQLVSGLDESRPMPPDGNPRLTSKQISLLRAWIDQGAIWPEGVDVIDPKRDRSKTHWAFERLRPVTPPARSSDDAWSKSPIDLFIRERLRDAGLRPARPADARALARRLYFDLIGLPPTPEQTQVFTRAHAENPDLAIRGLVDQLLDSPHYGERWGRHWLDVARYADSDGQEADADRPDAYVYRDFVIQAFNDDMPYDQFVRWQIAGDEYEPENDAAVSATGFLTAGTAFKLPDTFLESERLLNRYNELDDVVSTVGSGFLGLTVACARCHDHKYDAFSAKEYYQLLGVFHSGDRVAGKLPSGKDGFFFQDFDGDRRTTWLFRRSDFFDREIEVGIGFPAMLSATATAEEYWQQAKTAYGEFGAAKSTLQRRALAEWMTDTERGGGALLGRVLVNRVWHHHFGQGIVRTTSDFGVRGDAPSHPQLLNYLAHEFVQNGWNIKSLHRKILTSAVWQQASTLDAIDERGLELDPANDLLWRMTPQRLDAEVIRDSMLAVSKNLNLQAGGPGFKPYIAPEANLARNIKGTAYPREAKDDATTRRRSVYMFHKRLIPYPMFQAFDRPDLMTSCDRRQNTTVAPQAMVLLNDRFVRAVAHDFATLLLQKSTDDSVPPDVALHPIIATAFEISFARMPTQTEREASIQFIQAQARARFERAEQEPHTEALADFCQALFGSNEFIYVD